jgi:hypothetical protein
MVIHEPKPDVKGSGRWDVNTTRYVPVTGGSRVRLPLADDPAYRRYPGFVGMDERFTPEINTMHKLYEYLGGKPFVPEGPEGGFTQLILDETVKKMQKHDETESAKGH